MTPSLWFWAPQFHYPFSGSVAQHIDPKTSFFSAIKPEAGNALQKLIESDTDAGRRVLTVAAARLQAAESSRKKGL